MLDPIVVVFVLLPLLVVRQERLFRRAMQAYLLVLTVAYIGFVAYPTVAPRPAEVLGEGFSAWCLRLQYSLDQEYNCFPSLHVAHSFVSALTCYRVDRGSDSLPCFGPRSSESRRCTPSSTTSST